MLRKNKFMSFLCVGFILILNLIYPVRNSIPLEFLTGSAKIIQRAYGLVARRRIRIAEAGVRFSLGPKNI